MTEICRPVSVLSDTNKGIGKNDTQTQTVRVFVARPEAHFCQYRLSIRKNATSSHAMINWNILVE